MAITAWIRQKGQPPDFSTIPRTWQLRAPGIHYSTFCRFQSRWRKIVRVCPVRPDPSLHPAGEEVNYKIDCFGLDKFSLRNPGNDQIIRTPEPWLSQPQCYSSRYTDNPSPSATCKFGLRAAKGAKMILELECRIAIPICLRIRYCTGLLLFFAMVFKLRLYNCRSLVYSIPRHFSCNDS